MHGRRVRDLRASDLPAAEDCYFSIALMIAGAQARTVENAVSVHAVVIDDVGTKIDRDAFEMFCPLQPSWVVETSPGNHQVGFVITDGCVVEDYRRLRSAMATHPVWGHSDAAMDPVHLYRLPQGTNTKHGWRLS
jgi:hypothetical protein